MSIILFNSSDDYSAPNIVNIIANKIDSYCFCVTERDENGLALNCVVAIHVADMFYGREMSYRDALKEIKIITDAIIDEQSK